MAKLAQKYNTEDNKTGMNDFTAIPAGKYVAQIVKSELKENSKKTGHFISLHMKLVGGKENGRMIFENLNVDNPSAVAVEIANKTLNSICQACQKVGVEDTEELHGIPMAVTLKVDKATATRPASNSVVNYGICTEIPEVVEKPSGSMDKGEVADVGVGVKKKLPWEVEA